MVFFVLNYVYWHGILFMQLMIITGITEVENDGKNVYNTNGHYPLLDKYN